jgi:hypothetical protein
LPDDRSEWEVRVGLFATREQAEDVLTRIQRLLCPEPEHRSPCPIPWMIWLDEADGRYPGLVEQHAASDACDRK